MIRGEIWWADFGLPFGGEPGFERPVLIVQADAFNASRLGTTIIVPFTTNTRLAEAPGNVKADREETDLPKVSVVVVSQVTVIDRARLRRRHGALPYRLVREVESGLALVLGLRA